jgi:hypothetical protein
VDAPRRIESIFWPQQVLRYALRDLASQSKAACNGHESNPERYLGFLFQVG